MTPEENVVTYRRLIDAVNAGNLDALDELCAADIIDHNPIPDQAPGIEGIKQWAASIHTAFSNMQATIEDAFGAGDRVAGRVVWRGNHDGPFLGLENTGKLVQFTAMHIMRFEDGKAAEWWGAADLYGARQQLDAN